jgi:acetyltransferase-like isoleucine patch superfamily enzyme
VFDWLANSLNLSNGSAADRDPPLHPHAFALAPVFGPDLPETHPAASVWRRFRACATIADDCRLGVMAWCTGTPQQIRIGSRTICRSLLLCETGEGSIEIGELVYLGDNVIVSGRVGIRIGARTLIAHGVQIFDNDSHPIDAQERHADYLNLLAGKPRSKSIGGAPVVIGEDCWLGVNSIVLKGVTIGPRSVVAAGSVVVEDVAADCVVAGNPARVIRSLA